jgi:hypothetical protein
MGVNIIAAAAGNDGLAAQRQAGKELVQPPPLLFRKCFQVVDTLHRFGSRLQTGRCVDRRKFV